MRMQSSDTSLSLSFLQLFLLELQVHQIFEYNELKRMFDFIFRKMLFLKSTLHKFMIIVVFVVSVYFGLLTVLYDIWHEP